jgi:hypothetical protein
MKTIEDDMYAELKLLRKLNAELVQALKAVLKDRRFYALSSSTIDLVQLALAKAEELK